MRGLDCNARAVSVFFLERSERSTATAGHSSFRHPQGTQIIKNQQSSIQSSILNPILSPQSNPQSSINSAIVSLQSSVVNVLPQRARGFLHQIGLDEMVDVPVEHAIDIAYLFLRPVVLD
jgi:hypothetical protein